MSAGKRRYGDKDSHPIPLWNGVFEHYDRIGDALWEFAWCIDKVTEERDGIGIVLGGSPVKLGAIVDSLKGSAKETVRRHMDVLEKGKYIRRRRTPYGHVIEVLNSRKFGIWKHSKEKLQIDVSLDQVKPIGGSQKPIHGSEKPKNSINKEDSAGTQQKDSAVGAASALWNAVGVAAVSVPGPFRKLAEELWPTRNGQSLFDFMGAVLNGWRALGSDPYPSAWVKRKKELSRTASIQTRKAGELAFLERMPPIPCTIKS